MSTHLDSKKELHALLKLKKTKDVVPSVDIYQWGPHETYRWFNPTNKTSVVVDVISKGALLEAIDRYAESMSTPCSESIADFYAARDVYLALLESKAKLSDKQYVVNTRVLGGK